MNPLTPTNEAPQTPEELKTENLTPQERLALIARTMQQLNEILQKKPRDWYNTLAPWWVEYTSSAIGTWEMAPDTQ